MPRNRLTYFKKMSAAKVALRLNHESFTFEQRIFIAKCCTFHGKAPLFVIYDGMFIVTYVSSLYDV
jgi:hypothetical protein